MALALVCDAPPRAHPGMGFTFTDHACKYCTGRVVQSGDQFRCSVCEVVTMGSPHEICGCSILPRSRGVQSIRCAINPNPTPANPARVVIAFGERAA